MVKLRSNNATLVLWSINLWIYSRIWRLRQKTAEDAMGCTYTTVKVMLQRASRCNLRCFFRLPEMTWKYSYMAIRCLALPISINPVIRTRRGWCYVEKDKTQRRLHIMTDIPVVLVSTFKPVSWTSDPHSSYRYITVYKPINIRVNKCRRMNWKGRGTD